MTLADRFIPYLFWCEYGIGKMGIYAGILSLGIAITTLLTVKGIYFPMAATALLIVGLLTFATLYGWFLDTRNIMGRMNSHMNRKGNPEILNMMNDIEEIKRILEEMSLKEKLI